MLSAAASVCIRCRHEFLTYTTQNTWKRSIHTTTVLQRGKLKKKPPFRQHTERHQNAGGAALRHDSKGHAASTKKAVFGSPDLVRLYLKRHLPRWAALPTTLRRLQAMGLSMGHAQLLLERFVNETTRAPDALFPPEKDEKWQMQRIMEEVNANNLDGSDRALTKRFMDWAVETLSSKKNIFPPYVLSTIKAVHDALDCTHPAEWYPTARMLRRKVHMHVGPTNSGKTHNALRALAAAKHGVYASPLRLLAYEVFDRLNNGRIVPLGADPSAPPETFKRACNLVTGEEIRTVDEDAGLLSCTVEMINHLKRFDVAVVDEIQMISDSDRGGAWSAAVLGLHAEELHLCGEAGAVPLLQSMLAETGDEIIVHRYERLTPLTVAPESLRGDLKKIQRGDCVVSFSRTMLFAMKKEIETKTGMRCAIIYGRLPPEVRSEQAELFNDPNSGYDVLVGSDAIGMGLNLKIKRIVFESSYKFDGVVERPLSLSQLKQIAGRAGRYGLHGADSDQGGVVTTLHERDLPAVRKAVETRMVPVSKRAVIPTIQATFHKLEQLIRPAADFAAVFDILRTGAHVAPCYTLRDLGRAADKVVPIIDKLCADQTLDERLRVLLAPVQWADAAVAEAMENFLKAYRKDMNVGLRKALKGLKLTEALDEVKQLRNAATAEAAGDSSASTSSEPLADDKDSYRSDRIIEEEYAMKPVPTFAPKMATLLRLESLYRVTVVYMWFSLRLPLTFSEREEAVQMKEECEQLIEWSLGQIQAARKHSKAIEGKTEVENSDMVEMTGTEEESQQSGHVLDNLPIPKEVNGKPRKSEFIHPEGGILDALALSP